MSRIMLVDDDKNLQRVYVTLFKMNDMEVIAQAFDGVEAVEQYETMNPKPDAVIMDQRMPRMDGITATKMIIDINPKANVIFLSADDTAEDKAKASGARLFLNKPISIEKLLESIKKIVSENND